MGCWIRSVHILNDGLKGGFQSQEDRKDDINHDRDANAFQTGAGDGHTAV
jgi:hypothetical protein